jgi:hypothetical protein
MAGVEGLEARPLFVVVAVVVWMPDMASPLVSMSSRFMGLSSRLPTKRPPTISRSCLSSTSIRCSSVEFVADSFIEAFTSGRIRPVMLAAAPRSGAAVTFCLFEADEGGRCLAVSVIDWAEFCLARDEACLPPFAGRGDARRVAFESGNVLRMGDEASDGDIATDVTVLFLVGITLAAARNQSQLGTYLFLPPCPFAMAVVLDLFFAPSGPGVPLGLPLLPFVADPLLANTPLRARSITTPPLGPFSTFRRFGGLPFVPPPFAIPSPTEIVASAAFRTLLFPWSFLLDSLYLS